MRKLINLIHIYLSILIINICVPTFAGRVETRARENFRTDHIVKSNEQYTYKACEKFNRDDSQDYFIRCHDGEVQEETELDLLDKNINAINIKFYKGRVLADLKEASLATLEYQERSMKNIIECLASKSNAECASLKNTLVENTRENLFKLRQELALAQDRETIKHTIGDTKIPRLIKNEVNAFKETRDFLNYQAQQEWFEQRSKRVPCIEKDVSGSYSFKDTKKNDVRGYSCANMMSNELSRFLSKEYDLRKEKYESLSLDRLNTMPILSKLSLVGNEDSEVVTKKLAQALSNNLNEVLEARKRIKSLSNSNLYEVFSNSVIVENYLNKMGPPKYLCDIAQGYQEQIEFDEIKTDLALVGTALIGGGICGLTAGIGCALGVGITVEAANLAISANRVSDQEVSFLSGLSESKNLLEKEDDYTLNLVLAPLAIGGEFIGKGVKYTVKGVKQTKLPYERKATSLVDNYQKSKIRKISNHTPPRLTTAKQLEHEYSQYILTSPRLNQRWIDNAQKGDAAFYLDVENSALKRLNDSYGNKEVVTSLTNLHKDIMMQKMKRLFKNYPELDFEVYSDFKSLRFAFLPKTMTKEMQLKIQEELSKIYKETNAEFKEKIEKIGLFDAKEAPENWFSGAIALTADQAGLASKKSRFFLRSDSINENLLTKYDEVKPLLEVQVLGLRKFQSQLAGNKKFLSSPYFVKLSSDQTTLAPEIIDTLRKYDPQMENEKLVSMLSDLKQEYGLEFTQGEARDLLTYVQDLNALTPGLWVPKRELAHLNNATAGGFTGDVTGMGSQNIYQIAKDIAKSRSEKLDLEDTITSIRLGEREVTQSFNQIKKEFELTVREELQRKGIAHDIICSGDDCAVTIKETIKIEDQRDIIRSFSSNKNPSQYRMSFIPDNTPQDLRLKIASHGEMVEKVLRKSLRGLGESDIPPEILKNITIATSMPSKVGQAPIDVLIGYKNLEKLTQKQRSNIVEKLKVAISKVNQEILTNKDGYLAGSIIFN